MSDVVTRTKAIAAAAHAAVAKERVAEATFYRSRFPQFYWWLSQWREVFGPIKVKRIEDFETGEVIEPKRRAT